MENEKHSEEHREIVNARFPDGHSTNDEKGNPLGPATTVDTEKGSSAAYANSEIGIDLREDRKKAERRLLWKLGK